MKKAIIFPIILIAISGCTGKKQPTDGLITVDVTANYPEKELILQDFMDVEYVLLETADTFLTQGLVEDIGKTIILVRNQINDGNIYVFDRSGNGIRKINRKGQGSEEYTSIAKLFWMKTGAKYSLQTRTQENLWYTIYTATLSEALISLIPLTIPIHSIMTAII
jgi:hypothetical protein